MKGVNIRGQVRIEYTKDWIKTVILIKSYGNNQVFEAYSSCVYCKWELLT